MIGGIPGETKVASIAMYQHVETGQYGHGHSLAIALIILAVVLLTITTLAQRRRSS